MKVLSGSIRRKLLVAVSITLVSGIAAVLTIGTSLQIRDSRETILKATSTLSENIAESFRSELQQSANRARSFLVQSLKGASLTDLLKGDPSLERIVLWDVATRKNLFSAHQRESFQPLVSRAPANGETQIRIFKASKSLFLRSRCLSQSPTMSSTVGCGFGFRYQPLSVF